MREIAVGPQVYEVHSQTIGFLGQVIFDLRDIPFPSSAVIWIVTDRPEELEAAA